MENILIISVIITLIALALDIVVAGILVIFGFFANKKHKWSFIIGMILYALDGLVFLVFGDIISVGFHIFALFGIYTGIKALKQLRVLQESESLSPWES